MGLDITGNIGELFHSKEEAEWPMYSYSRPAYMLWNAIANGLHAKGWKEREIKEWLQSKNTRWALDGDLGDKLMILGLEYAKSFPDKGNKISNASQPTEPAP